MQARCEAASESAKAEVSTHQNKEQQDEIRHRSNEQNDSVVFGPPTLEERIEAMKKENERLLHELQESESITMVKVRREFTSLVWKDFQVVAKISSFIQDFLTIQL